jgi:hypothetical protein
MPAGEALDDDYVVSLLLKDADANKKRYLSSGLGSLLSKPRTGNAPKPNTRFLRNIIKETDSHNAALKAKEEEESRARLRDLRNEQRGSKRSHDDALENGSRKRQRGEDNPGRWANVLGGLGNKSGSSARTDPSSRSQEKHNDSRHRRDRRRSRSPNRQSRSRRHGKEAASSSTRRHRSPPPRRNEHRSTARRRGKDRSSSRSGSPERRRTRQTNVAEEDAEDSDPLEDIIGPRPPPKVVPRGRGAYKPTSTIDARFDPNYNPRTDVDLSPDDGERDDWDMALEALRDRAKWRAQGGERLRAAGFSEDEVKKWEKGSGLVGEGNDGAEKDIDDVRWTKKGESREWDRGKVVGEDGGVDLKPEWGRLKGT